MRMVKPEGIDEVVRRSSILELAFERGIRLEPLGPGLLVGRCPFERDAVGRSLIVERERGVFRCVSCWARGNAVGFVMQLDHIRFRAAVEILARRAGLDMQALLDPEPRRTSDVPSWALTPAVAGLV